MEIQRPIKVKRSTKTENRFHPKMGSLVTKVTRIQKTFLGIPFTTLYKYRETYSGKIKDCDDCELSLLN
ncbi:hypothetical protein KRX57_06765 [Weeksellaceae bacterium TAE3-ERU29]|nr:hypothetical protein [Weeksellaceae bacterium TAE3-ERU29]